MKKSGFTLAEVLITLGIIGVVAALTAPALVMNSRNQANAAKLSVTMSNLENAFTNMIVTEGVDNLFQTEAWDNADSRPAFAGRLGQHLHTNGFRNDTIAGYYGDNPMPAGLNGSGSRAEDSVQNVTGNMEADAAFGRNEAGDALFPFHIIELKNGATVFITPCGDQNPTEAEKDAIIDAGGALFNQAAGVFIDVNGSAAPNVLGRDLFYFYLGENGILYPVGGRDSVIFDNNTAYWENGCPINGEITDFSYSCTGRVVAEGYRITY